MTARRGTFEDWWHGPGGRWFRREALAGKPEASPARLAEMRASPGFRRDRESIRDWLIRTDELLED
jgi:hypothetical protein